MNKILVLCEKVITGKMLENTLREHPIDFALVVVAFCTRLKPCAADGIRVCILQNLVLPTSCDLEEHSSTLRASAILRIG
jgi:hypothetical protein